MQQWVAAAVLGGALAAAVAGAYWQGPVAAVGDVIAVVRVEGVIAAGQSEDLLGSAASANSDRLMDVLEEIRDDQSVKAVVLRVNSPGGTASAAYEVGRELDRLRQAGKKIVTSMGDVAASGGYWVAAHTDYIYATPGTITGSIGVIMQTVNLEELYRKIGVEPETVKSGPYKDMGASDRPLTDAEREILQGMVDQSYEDFVAVVARGRDMNPERVRELADGRIYLGSQAKEAGLVDELGNLKDAIQHAAELAGLQEGQYAVEEYGRRSRLEEWLGIPTALSRLVTLLEHGVGQAVTGPAPLEAR